MVIQPVSQKRGLVIVTTGALAHEDRQDVLEISGPWGAHARRVGILLQSRALDRRRTQLGAMNSAPNPGEQDQNE